MKGHRKVSIEIVWDIEVDNISVMFQTDPYLPKRVIVLTR